MTRAFSRCTGERVALCFVLATLSIIPGADSTNTVHDQPSSVELQTARLEFWTQTFTRQNAVANLATIPLLRDQELKQFKVVYFTKLGEGMDVGQVDAAMTAAFQEYDQTQDRARLMKELHAIEPLLNAYEAPPYTKDQFVYVAMGASISQGGGASPASKGWVYTVADRLREVYPEARVRNLAVGGTTTQEARDVQLPEALKCHPDVVTYTAGINDLQYGVPPETVRENTDFVLRELTEKTDATVVMTLMPDFKGFPALSLGIPQLEQRKANLTPERFAQFNAIFRELAAEHGATLVDIGSMFAESQADNDKLFSFDGVHPNNSGHARIADIFWAAIEQIVAAPNESVQGVEGDTRHPRDEGVTGNPGAGQRVWNLEAIKTMPLAVEVLSETRSEADGKQYLEREILYTSQVTNGKPVRALAYLTIPLGATEPLPALVSIRALWGPSHKDNSVGYAQEYGVVSLGVHLPEGESKAVWPEGFAEITDHDKDYEKSYFYLLAIAAMRGITYLETLPEVNPTRIGITGLSRGGMAVLIVNGVDDRIRMAMPVAATGFSRQGVGHLKEVLGKPGEEGRNLLVKSTVRFNPLDYARTQHGATFMVIGAQDPVFPYTEAARTFEVIPGEKRLEVIFDWGHGNYLPDQKAEAKLGESAEKKLSRVKLNTKAWIERWLFNGEPLPDTPSVELKAIGNSCSFIASIEPQDATRTLLLYSTDGARTFEKVNMRGEGNQRKATVQVSAEERTRMTYYVEVEYAERCFLSSPPAMGDDFEEKG